MLIRRKDALLKIATIGVVSLTFFSSAIAGGVPSPLPPTLPEHPLLQDNKNYPEVELRKKMSDNCYCNGGYFKIEGGYALGGITRLNRTAALPINPGTVNALIPAANSAGKGYTGGLYAGYKFANLRVEAGGGYRRNSSFDTGFVAGGGTGNINARTSHLTGTVAAFYDLDMENMPITPYIGGGMGLAFSNTLYNISYKKGGVTTNGSVKFKRNYAFVGAAMAGVALQVGKNIVLDAGYKYSNIFGSAATYDGQTNGTALNAASAVNLVNLPGVIVDEKFDYPNSVNHEVKLGIRYMF